MTYESTEAAAVLDATLPDTATSVSWVPRGRAILGCWWITFSASSLFVVSGHLLIKAGLTAAASRHIHPGFLGLLQTIASVEVLGGLLVYFLGSLCWMTTVAKKEISFLYPLSSINYVLVVIASYVLFAESISEQRAAGVALIVLGMVLMNRKSKDAK
jgi:drug/metabolite transporter (DMT)-like permease